MLSRVSHWLVVIFLSQSVFGSAADLLIKFDDGGRQSPGMTKTEPFLNRFGGRLELVSRPGNLYRWRSNDLLELSPIQRKQFGIRFIQPNYPIAVPANPSLVRNQFQLGLFRKSGRNEPLSIVKPDIEKPPAQSSGVDPDLASCWGLVTIGADKAWDKTSEGAGITIAVIDTGVDYNHEDLIANIWHNEAEIADNNVDDDQNGFVDDIIGWDFVNNDNKPYDITENLAEILFKNGNPGHGTHIAGILGAVRNNAIGMAGVAPSVKIMPIRFMDEHQQSTTANAIKSIDYAVAIKAQIINASWGTEGEDSDGPALKEAIERAGEAGVLVVAAAGNGRTDPSTGQTLGYDNDSDPKPVYPASYDLDNVISVAAADSNDNLAPFSNYGKNTVDLAAPGVKIFSTVPGNQYQDTVASLGQTVITWDGTSMAAPFVAGSLAVIASQNLGSTGYANRRFLFGTAERLSGLADKVATGGRIDLRGLISRNYLRGTERDEKKPNSN